MITISITTRRRSEFIDITSQIEEVVRASGIEKGVCIIFCPHTTAGLVINENADPSVRRDIIQHLEELVPYQKGYTHTEGNADSHIKSSLLGSSLSLIIEGGKIMLGTWQGIYFCEFDGPRKRKVHLKLVSD